MGSRGPRSVDCEAVAPGRESAGGDLGADADDLADHHADCSHESEQRANRASAWRLQARRSDLAELSSAGEVVCSAKLGAKKLKVTATFPADRATCSGVVPKTAKGKTLQVTVTLTLDGVRVTRTASIKVK